MYRFVLAQALLWGLCLVNVLGIKVSARIQISVLFLNVVPLLLFSIIALFYFEPANLTPFAPKGWGSLVTGVALIVWAYSGIESATVPAEEVRGTGHTIGRATLIGYAVGTAAGAGFAGLLYKLLSGGFGDQLLKTLFDHVLGLLGIK